MNKKNIKKYILNVAIILLVGGLSIYFSIGNQLEGTIESLSHCSYSYAYFLFDKCYESYIICQSL